MLNEKIFREYDIRGVADVDLTSPVVEELGKAIGTFALEKGAKTFTIGRDCRTSSSRIRDALTLGLTSTGIDVIDVGLVPTPVLYFSLIDQKADGGVMITGSHNPGDYNGLKVCVGPSTIHGEEIQQIKHIQMSGKFPSGKGSSRQTKILDRYIDNIVGGIKQPLPVKVVLDGGNGMAGVAAPRLLRELGCDVVELFSRPDGSFPNHHPDPTVLKNLKHLIEAVEKHQAILGIGFDGDADRIGVVDRSGRVIYGDELLILYARQVLKSHPGATIISEVKASHRFYNDVKARGGKAIMWKTGHSLIKAKMKEVDALLAGEMSGHMFFKDRYFGFDDAIYAAARIAEIVATEGKSPGELLADIPSAFTTPEIRVDCPDNIKFEVVEKARDYLTEKGFRVNPIDGARVEFEDGWGLVRASNTQPVLVYRFEAQTEKRLEEIRKVIEIAVSRFIP